MFDFEGNLKRQFTRRPGDQSEIVCLVDLRLLVVPDADGNLRLWDL